MITVPLVGSLVRGCASGSMTIATPLIPAVKASAKALSMGSFPSSASILHWLFAWAIFHRYNVVETILTKVNAYKRMASTES